MIRDFEPDDDTINLARLAGVDCFADVRAAATQVGGTLLLSFAEGRLQLPGVTLAQLDSGDFVF